MRHAGRMDKQLAESSHRLRTAISNTHWASASAARFGAEKAVLPEA
jgi:hypothetical protein